MNTITVIYKKDGTREITERPPGETSTAQPKAQFRKKGCTTCKPIPAPVRTVTATPSK